MMDLKPSKHLIFALTSAQLLSIKILSESKYKYNKATPLPSLLFRTLPTLCRVFVSPVAFVVPSHRAIHCRCCAACHAAAHCRRRVTRHFRRAARRHAARCCHQPCFPMPSSCHLSSCCPSLPLFFCPSPPSRCPPSSTGRPSPTCRAICCPAARRHRCAAHHHHHATLCCCHATRRPAAPCRCLPPFAIVEPPVTYVVSCHCVARRLCRAALSCRQSPSSCRLSPSSMLPHR